MDPLVRSLRTTTVALCLPGLFVTSAPARADAQVVAGRTTSEASGAALGLVAIQLLDTHEGVVSSAVSDSSGVYAMEVPEDGAYYVQADMLGYQPLRTPLLKLSVSRRVTADFELRADPIGLEGLKVEIDVTERLERELASFGVHPDAIGERFVSSADIARRATARDFGHVLQWQSIPGMQVTRGDEVDPRPSRLYICVRLRPRADCAVMVLNGARITLETAYDIPADALRAIVVLTPEESTLLYGTDGGGGAVLLFTR